ncbi:GNAT family N-acetyltransferase [Roseivirga sp. BDSF3-8]|uniref:GNAT family N-acetyltransferase n=1 Tax=Roseivirga sp. BDSF3-8 TaxID=3241598 RepID=UPI00353181D2
MRQANPEDKPHIIKTIAAAFKDNKSTNYVIRQDTRTPSRLTELVNYCYQLCHQFGHVWVSDDGKACAMVMLPHQKKTTFNTIGLDIRLATRAIGLSRVGKVMSREAVIKKEHPVTPFAYLWYIGTAPHVQRKGSGTTLLQEIISFYTTLNLPLYLETSTEHNLPWYQKHGFEIYHTIDFGFTFYMLRRAVR